MERLHKNNDGFALILTILIIALITAVTIELNSSMRDEFYAAANLGDSVIVENIAKSGFDYALAVLYADSSAGESSQYDSLNETWADSRNLTLDGIFDDGGLELNIIDLSGKIPINKLVDEQGQYNPVMKDFLKRFFSNAPFNAEEDEIDSALDAIKDWIDKDNDTSTYGAEDSYYKSVGAPFSCKNGPIESAEELLSIKDVRDFIIPGQERFFYKYFTVYGYKNDDKININTADPLILMALSSLITKDMVDNMIEYRNNPANDIESPLWYQRVPGMGGVVIDQQLITTKSTYFEIRATGYKNDMKKNITAIVKRINSMFELQLWNVS